MTIGYFGSNVRDGTPDLNPLTSFRDRLQIPFVGIYGAASYAGFLVDGQVREDFFQDRALTITMDWPVSVSMRAALV